MNNQRTRILNQIASKSGFTLFELIICILIIGLLSGIAIPTLNTMKQSQDYKGAARNISTMLREAKSVAVSTNNPQMVVFKPNSSSYSWISYNTTTSSWTNSPAQKKTVPSSVTMKSTSAGTSTANVYVQFNTNGTASLKAPSGIVSDGNVSLNSVSKQIYVVTITNTGRVSIVRK